NVVNNKKVKLEQSTNDIKNKKVQSIIKNDSLKGKVSKILPIKESNQTIIANDNTANLSLSKVRTSTKLVKSQSTNDIKTSIQSTTSSIKKKEPITSPSKTKLVTNLQNVSKKTINKNPSKPSNKTEQTVTSIVKSPSNNIIKQELLSQSQSSSSSSSSTNTCSNNANTSVPITNLKKIPRKPVPTLPSSTVVGKQSRPSISSSSSSSS
ncbi:unnamed protein product, partial [Rotaria magnacalcarata]